MVGSPAAEGGGSPRIVVFAHGLEGSPEGAKATEMRREGLPVVVPDFRGMILAERVALLDRVTREESERSGPLVLAGSSYGGLAAAWVAMRHPARFAGLVLLAPALGHVEPPVRRAEDLVAPRGLPTVILHGRRDRIVPVELSRAYRDRSGAHVRLVELDDDHRLGASLHRMIAELRALLRREER